MARSKRPAQRTTKLGKVRGGQDDSSNIRPKQFLLTSVRIEHAGDPEKVAEGLWNAISGALPTLTSQAQYDILCSIQRKIDDYVTRLPGTSRDDGG